MFSLTVESSPMDLVLTQLMVVNKLKHLFKSKEVDPECKYLLKLSLDFVNELMLKIDLNEENFKEIVKSLIKKYKSKSKKACEDFLIITNSLFAFSSTLEDFLSYLYLTIWSIINSKRLNKRIFIFNRFLFLKPVEEILLYYRVLNSIFDKIIKSKSAVLIYTQNKFKPGSYIVQQLMNELELDLEIQSKEELNDKLISIKFN